MKGAAGNIRVEKCIVPVYAECGRSFFFFLKIVRRYGFVNTIVRIPSKPIRTQQF